MATKGMFLCSLTFIGCSSSTAVPVSDIDSAKQLLNDSFMSWKSGRSVDDLRLADPPVYVAEDLWTSDFKLTEFSIDGDGEMYGTSVRLPVTLTGAGKNNAPVKRQFAYLVTTTPASTIARSDR